MDRRLNIGARTVNFHEHAAFKADLLLTGQIRKWLREVADKDEDGCWIWRGGVTGKSEAPVMARPRALPAIESRPISQITVRKLLGVHYHGEPKARHVYIVQCGKDRCVAPECIKLVSRSKLNAMTSSVAGHQKRITQRKAIAKMRRERSPVSMDHVMAIRAEYATIKRGNGGPHMKSTPGKLAFYKRWAADIGCDWKTVQNISLGVTWNPALDAANEGVGMFSGLLSRNAA